MIALAAIMKSRLKILGSLFAAKSEALRLLKCQAAGASTDSKHDPIGLPYTVRAGVSMLTSFRTKFRAVMALLTRCRLTGDLFCLYNAATMSSITLTR